MGTQNKHSLQFIVHQKALRQACFQSFTLAGSQSVIVLSLLCVVYHIPQRLCWAMTVQNQNTLCHKSVHGQRLPAANSLNISLAHQKTDKYRIESLHDAQKVERPAERVSVSRFECTRELISHPSRPVFIYHVGACVAGNQHLQHDTMPLKLLHAYLHNKCYSIQIAKLQY